MSKDDISNAIAEYLSVHDNLAYEVEMSDWIGIDTGDSKHGRR